MKRRVAIYARVSTAEQSVDPQLAELREFAERRGFVIVREYVDQVTGAVERRRKGKATEYDQLMRDAHRRKFDCVLVWKFDRFARTLGVLVNTLAEFASLNIDFISCTESIDTTTPAGRLFYHVIGSFAQFEREIIVERVNAGLRNAKAKGVVLGRPRDLAMEARVKELRAAGQSLKKIAGATGLSIAGVHLIVNRDRTSPETA
jgi:DNA invertase Pin-like site-specific DNA recombinase